MTPLVRLALSILFVGVLVAPAAAQSGSFGNAVQVDGDALIVGEPNNTFRPGTFYLYRKQAGAWVESGTLTAPDAER